MVSDKNHTCFQRSITHGFIEVCFSIFNHEKA
jgi:hypothetical protein